MGAPAEESLIYCSARSLLLSCESCVASWRRAQEHKPEPWSSRWHCRDCPDGSARAGVRVERPQLTPSIQTLLALCARCHRPAARIVSGRHCVSCYNRERELLRGANRAGDFPSQIARRYHLHACSFLYRPDEPDGAWRTEQAHDIANMLEAFLIVLRRERRPTCFARCGTVAATLLPLNYEAGDDVGHL